MTNPFATVPAIALADLARALESRGAGWPPSATELRRIGLGESAGTVAAELEHIAAAGAPAASATWALNLVTEERESARKALDRIELVWTGPEMAGSRSRDTSVVVRELFSSAEKSVLVSTYAIHQGKQVFEPLARRMDERSGLSVRFFVHVDRPHLDQTPESQILKAFAERFRTEWPGERLPQVYYDRRSLAMTTATRASLHAKCVIVDDRRSFVTSANFTEAAQDRNMEAGVLVDDPGFATALRDQFDSLLRSGELESIGLC